MAALERVCFPTPWSSDTVKMVLESPCCSAMGIQDVGGHLRGYILYAVQGGLCHLLSLGVAPAHRRSGLGTRLLGEVVAAVLGSGIHKIFLEAREGNEAARAFYRELGFAPVGRRSRYYPDTGEDALVLVREIDVAPMESRGEGEE